MSHRPALNHLASGEGKSVPIGKVDLSFKAGATVGSPYAVAEMSFPAGAAQSLHGHPWEETMYVLEGEVEMLGENGDRRVAGPGCVLHVPSGAAHGFVNVGTAAARLLIVGPLAQEAYFDDLSAAISRKEGAEAIAAVKARHGAESLGPVAARGEVTAIARALLTGIVATMVLAAGCDRRDSNGPTQAGAVKRGETLVRAGACNDCHTPMKFDEKLGMPVPQVDRMLSGHPAGAPDPATTLAAGDQAVIGPTFTSFRLPFGVVYTANITPDAETGLGGWTEAQFVATVRTGQHLGLRGRPVLPPMPWMSLRELSDGDLGAIWAYLRSIPAVKNRVPPPKVPAPMYAEITKGYDAVLAPARP